MTTQQVEQLAALQRWLFTEVEREDQSKVREVLEVMWYWVRKQVWWQVWEVMIECEKDLDKAAKFDTVDVWISNDLRNDFMVLQGELIRAEGAQEDGRPQKWLHYIGWVSAVIDQEILNRTTKYVRLRATNQNAKHKKR